jgi:hypothetical protein
MKKYYAVELCEYDCGELVDTVIVERTAHPETLYDMYGRGSTVIAYNLRPATRVERRAYRAGIKVHLIDKRVVFGEG